MALAEPRPASPPAQQLSLFDLPPTAAPATTPLPAVRPAPTEGAARFQHPRADRQIHLGEHRVGYAFRRARRRSIGFSIGPDGLTVAAPRWVSVADVEQALRQKAGWILRKLHEQHERQRRTEAARIDWRHGASLPFLGEPLTMLLDPRVSGAVLREAGPAVVAEPAAAPGRPPRQALHLGLPATAEAAQIRELVQGWLQRQALGLFKERCALYAPRLGVTVRRLSLSSAATRWGSASADGSVRLHWRLVHFTLPVIDYVVAHELAHLREMNHSPAFWDVVRSVLPDYEQHRGALRQHSLPALG